MDPRSASPAAGKRWRACDSVEELVGHIHSLRVRGAPLIGLFASLLLALLAERGLPRAGLEQALHTLRCAPNGGQPDE